MEYRRHEQPGCGGCFLLILLLIFITGGAPLLFEFLGLIVFGILFLLFSGVAAFWAFTYYMKRQVSAYEKSQTETHNTFVFLLVNILVKVAQIDGTVTRDEVKTIRQAVTSPDEKFVVFNAVGHIWKMTLQSKTCILLLDCFILVLAVLKKRSIIGRKNCR